MNFTINRNRKDQANKRKKMIKKKETFLGRKKNTEQLTVIYFSSSV